MSPFSKYLMESIDEIERLERKTDPDVVRRQAQWAGIQPGMRVADVGCGSGKTSDILYRMLQPGGSVVGLDFSKERVAFAQKKYGRPGLDFVCRNIAEPLDDLGRFDFVWVRFLLEYHRSSAFEIAKRVSTLARPGGILCLIDLDYNCMSHFGMPERLMRALHGCMAKLESDADFDPHVGIKLYSYLFDMGYEQIDVTLQPHHLIFGELKEQDAFNWGKKIEHAVRRSGYSFSEYDGGYEEFVEEFQCFFSSPRRFTYTPVIACRGRKP